MHRSLAVFSPAVVQQFLAWCSLDKPLLLGPVEDLHTPLDGQGPVGAELVQGLLLTYPGAGRGTGGNTREGENCMIKKSLIYIWLNSEHGVMCNQM